MFIRATLIALLLHGAPLVVAEPLVSSDASEAQAVVDEKCALATRQRAEQTRTMREPYKCTSVTVPVDLVFLVDGSGSVPLDGFQKSQEYVKDVVSELQVGTAPTDTRAAVVQFSTSQSIAISLKDGTDKAEINQAVDQMSRLGASTHTGDGIFKVRTEVFTDAREDAQKMIVVLTDGDPNGGRNTASEAEKARDEGINVVAIGVGQINEETLDDLAGGSQNVFKVDNFSELVTMVRAASTAVCTETGGYISTPQPTPHPTPQPTPQPTLQPTPQPTLPLLVHVAADPPGPLELCEGDCDNNGDCKDGLKCYQRDGYTSVPGCAGLGKKESDYCFDPSNPSMPSLQEVHDTWGQYIAAGQQLGACEGDCDLDSECQEGYVCFQRDDKTPVPGCSGEGTDKWDYCHEPVLSDLGLDPPEVKKEEGGIRLGQCQGDCDADAECAQGLECFHREESEPFAPVPGCAGEGAKKWDYCHKPAL